MLLQREICGFAWHILAKDIGVSYIYMHAQAHTVTKYSFFSSMLQNMLKVRRKTIYLFNICMYIY